METRKPIIITAPSANCGKTELACRLISALGNSQALKITRFHRESHCPVHGVDEQGEDNCDGCAPAPAGFELVTDDTILRTAGKDSDRMLKSGANPVLWLRAAPHVFEYALKAALKHFDPSRPLILEGNSAATVRDFPGTVVLLWPQKSRGVKTSVLPAMKRADVLLLVEDDNAQPRRWPKTLQAAMARQGLGQNHLPAPLWLKPGWWKLPETGSESSVLDALTAGISNG